MGGKSVQTFYSLRGRSPAYPLFRKEKIQLYVRRSTYDAERFERVLVRSDSLWGGSWVLRTESPSQGYRLSAASLPCPRRSFGTSHKGAEPTFCVCRRFMRSQEPLILLNSKNASTDAQSRLASLVICSKGTYGRGNRRRTNGTTVVEGFRSWQKIPPRRACERGSITLETFCGAGTPPPAGGSFFLYVKSVLRE